MLHFEPSLLKAVYKYVGGRGCLWRRDNGTLIIVQAPPHSFRHVHLPTWWPVEARWASPKLTPRETAQGAPGSHSSCNIWWYPADTWEIPMLYPDDTWAGICASLCCKPLYRRWYQAHSAIWVHSLRMAKEFHSQVFRTPSVPASNLFCCMSQNQDGSWECKNCALKCVPICGSFQTLSITPSVPN
jgi:hypothetical protein